MSRRGSSQSPFTLFSFQDIITSVTGIMLLLTLILSLELSLRKPTRSPVSNAAMAKMLQESIESAREEIQRLEPLLSQGATAAEELAGSSVSDLKRQSEATQEQARRLEAELKQLEAELKRMQHAEEETLARSYEREADRKRLEELKQQAQEAKDKVAELKRSNSMIYNPDPGLGKRAWLVVVESGKITVTPVDRSEAPREYSGKSLAEAAQKFRAFIRTLRPSAEYFVLLIKPSGVDAFPELEANLRDASFDLGFDLIGEDQNPLPPPAEST